MPFWIHHVYNRMQGCWNWKPEPEPDRIGTGPDRLLTLNRLVNRLNRLL